LLKLIPFVLRLYLFIKPLKIPSSYPIQINGFSTDIHLTDYQAQPFTASDSVTKFGHISLIGLLFRRLRQN